MEKGTNKKDDNRKDPDIERLEKQVAELAEAVDPFKLAPRIVDIMIQGRGETTNYIDATYTLKCDVMLDIEWQGRRYRVPAFEL